MAQPSKPVPTAPRKTKSQIAAESRRRNYIIFSLVMVGVLGFSALAPLVTSGIRQQQPVIEPTGTPAPIVPTPIADLSSIGFDSVTMSESGLFSVAVPTGWEVGTNVAQGNEAQMTQRNANAGSVIETRVIQPQPAITDIAGVQAFFTDAWLRSSWRDYSSWNKAGDQVVGDHYITDFVLERLGNQYVARQEAWSDGTWLYLVRVVTPSNASDMLKYVLTGVRDSLIPNREFVGAPFEWQSHFDSVNHTLLRFPETWTVTDTAPGQPTSLQSDSATVLIEAISATVADADAASQWVAAAYGATVTSSEAVDHFGTPAFAVAYQVPSVDGGTTSGYAVLLPDGDTLNVADLRFPDANVDLNTASADGGYGPWKQMMASFSLFPNVGDKA